MNYLVLDDLLIFLVKSFFLLFFLISFSFYDIKEGRIPNKVLLFMLVIGILLNLTVDKEFFIEIIKNCFLFFIISFILWELALINAGDVKLLALIPLFFVYYTKISQIKLFIFYLISVFSVYLIFSLIYKIKRKKLDLKEVTRIFLNSLTRINLTNFILTIFTLFTIFYVLNLSFWLSFVLIFFVISLIDNIEYEKSVIYFTFLFIALMLFLNKNLYKNIMFYKQIAFLTFWILFFRYFLFILIYFSSIKEKKVEELKVNDKLAEVPVKFGNTYGLYKLIPFDLYSFYKIKELAIDDYNPSIGLQKENLSKIKRFFKQNKRKKVKVFEETPFVPFLLIAFILTFFSILAIL